MDVGFCDPITMLFRIAALALPLLAAACFDVSAEGVACGEDDLCPSGLECISGMCLKPGTVVATIDGGETPDQAVDPPDAAVPLGPFGAAAPVDAVNSAALEDDPTVTADNLELFFNRDNSELWVSKRDSVGEPWGTPTQVTGLGGPVEEPHVLGGGKVLYFTREVGDPAQFDIYRTSRQNKNQPWGPPVALGTPVNLPGSNQRGPCVASNDRLMYIPSDEGGTFHLYRTTRASQGAAWTIPVLIADLPAADGIELDCWVDDLETELVFGSNRSPALAGDGDGPNPNLWKAVGDGAGGYSMIERSELNVADEWRVDPTLTGDRRTIYFSRAPDATPAEGDIYMATR